MLCKRALLLHVFVKDDCDANLEGLNPETDEGVGESEVDREREDVLLLGHLCPNMHLGIEAGEHSAARARTPAEHFRFPLLATDAALHGDRVIDADEAVALLLRHTAAVVPQWTSSALALRRAFLQD